MKRLVLVFLAALVLSLSALSAPETEEIYHQVKKGQGFIKIARIHGVDWKEMARLNNRQSPYATYVGEHLIIPSHKKVAKSRKAGLSPWRFPGKNKYKGGCEKGQAKTPQSIKETLENQLGEKSRTRGKYKELIPIFERRVREKNYFMKDIEQGEIFASMDFTRNKRTVTVYDQITDWDPEYVKKHNITKAAERYVEKFGNEEVTFTIPYACCNPAMQFRPLPPAPYFPPLRKPPAETTIVVIKEAFNTEDKPMEDVPAFTFKVDGVVEDVNNSSGRVVFKVDSGPHVVMEVEVEGWEQVSVTPPDGRVNVKEGETVVVVFKNRQVLPPREEAPPVTITPAPPTEEPTPEITPGAPPEETPLAPPAKIEELKIENELNGGGGGYHSGVAEGFFLYGNTVPWWFKGDGAGSRYGLGATTFFTRGKSDPFNSSWRQYNVVPQLAWKGFFPYGEDYELGQIYLRFLGYDVEKAKIRATGDKLTQRNFPTFGGRLEYERGNLKSWRYGAFTEASFAPHRDFNATFNGSSAKTHTAGGGVWARYPLSQNWSVQINLMSFYNWRDRSAPISIGPLFRWEKGLFFGPTFNIFSFRPDVYKKAGIPWKDLNSIGGFVQFEVHTLLWPLYRSSRQKSVVSTSPVPEELRAAVEAEKKVEVASAEPEASDSGITQVAYHTESAEESEHEVNLDTSRPEESEPKIEPILFDQNNGSPEVANPDFHPDLT